MCTSARTTAIFRWLAVSLLLSGCTPIPEIGANPAPPVPQPVITASRHVAPSAEPGIELPATDQILFTIPNPEPFSGREGEPRPNWAGWGAETFAVAPDGSFWIDDSAVDPDRLLHYTPQGELLSKISLENLVVYAFDLAVTQDSLWVLDISAQEPKIVQLSLDGTVRSEVVIPKKVMTQAGMFISNGAFNLSVGEKGELFLSGLNGYYEIVDASGQITAHPLDAFAYYGHIYRKGIYDEAARRLPLFVDGKPFEPSADFFPEADPFLGFNADGSFALAGYVQVNKNLTDYQVRYYNASGELLGLARQRPQRFYRDWNHHLAFGPDGSVYQLLSNPDHSVHILRLGFSADLPPLEVLPPPAPTPLRALHPWGAAATEEEQARNTLLSFFDSLSMKRYAEAAAQYGGAINEYARELAPGETTAEYWDYLCSTLLWCLAIADITETQQVSENEYLFYTVFMHPDGRRFEIGACCGGDPAASPAVWQFAYRVKKIEGEWKVMREPLFTP